MEPGEIRALEFFCGIGGMHCSLKSVAPHAVVLDAFDVSPIANDVYSFNFGRPINKLDLECITPQQLDAYAANLWMLSPPCQPHTRQGPRKGSIDNRSAAFSNLLNALAHMQQPPQWLMLENVVGFDHSDVHEEMIKALNTAGYHKQEFILSPLQYGIPYTRPRYFCLASKCPFPVSLPTGLGPCQATPALLLQLRDAGANAQTIQAAAQQHLASHVHYVQTLSEHLWNVTSQQQQQRRQGSLQQQRVATPSQLAVRTDQPQQGYSSDSHHHQQQQRQGFMEQQRVGIPTQRAATTEQSQQGDSSELHQQQQQQQEQQADHVLHELCGPHGCIHTGSSPSSSCPQVTNFLVPDNVLSKYAGVIRVVAGNSRNSNCFTKSYSQFAKGTGSLLASLNPVGLDPGWQLAGGIGSLVHCSTGSSSSSCLVGSGSASPFDRCADCADRNNTSMENHSVLDGQSARIQLRPGEVLLDLPPLPHQQQQQNETSDVLAGQCSSFSVQHLLLARTASIKPGAKGDPNICSSYPSSLPDTTSSSLSEVGSGHSDTAPYQSPVVLRPGELVIAAEERQQYTDEAIQQLAAAWKGLGIRYFTPLEIARLHSFPTDYKFPPHMTVKQCYQLLGNSLSVAVVADLLRYLLQSV